MSILESMRSPYRSAILVLAGVAAVAAVLYFSQTSPRLPYQDSFSSGRTKEWHAYAGSWETHDGTIRNLSEELGAKLLTGSPEWTDYSLDADNVTHVSAHAGRGQHAGEVEPYRVAIRGPAPSSWWIGSPVASPVIRWTQARQTEVSSNACACR